MLIWWQYIDYREAADSQLEKKTLTMVEGLKQIRMSTAIDNRYMTNHSAIRNKCGDYKRTAG